MLKRARILLRSSRVGVAARMFEQMLSDADESDLYSAPDITEDDDAPQSMEMFSDGRLRLTEDAYSLSYEESALTGMEGTSAQIFFRKDQPTLVTMLRSGAVSTALVFEPGKRHICAYRTPYMTFEVCVHTLSVANHLCEGASTLDLDYIIELRGAQAERCRLHLEVK